MGGNDAHWVNVLANTGAILTLLHLFGAICKNPQLAFLGCQVAKPDVVIIPKALFERLTDTLAFVA